MTTTWMTFPLIISETIKSVLLLWSLGGRSYSKCFNLPARLRLLMLLLGSSAPKHTPPPPLFKLEPLLTLPRVDLLLQL